MGNTCIPVADSFGYLGCFQFRVNKASISFCVQIFYFLTLQYCIGFAIYQHESATGIHVFPMLSPLPSASPYHPSGSSQCTSPKHPVSCIKPGLATSFIYDIIHISMPLSQIIPPSPSPTESKSLFYTSVSLLLSRTQGYCCHLSKFHLIFFSVSRYLKSKIWLDTNFPQTYLVLFLSLSSRYV